MFYFIPKLSYNLIWWPCRMLFSFFFHFKVETKENLKNLKGPLVIAASHASWVDPFLIAAVFPFWAKVFPIHYGCWYRYFYSPRFLPFVWLLGTFPIRKGLDFDESLKTPVRILKNKGVVGLFPEGKRKLGGRPRRARRGAAFLYYKTGAKVLPVKIEGSFNMKFSQFFKRKYRIKVKIGRPFSLPSQKINKIEDLNQPSGLIMEKIRGL